MSVERDADASCDQGLPWLRLRCRSPLHPVINAPPTLSPHPSCTAGRLTGCYRDPVFLMARARVPWVDYRHSDSLCPGAEYKNVT